MQRVKFYTHIDDWIARVFVRIGSPQPNLTFKLDFIAFIEAKCSEDTDKPWEIVTGINQLEDVLSDTFTEYLNFTGARKWN